MTEPKISSRALAIMVLIALPIALWGCNLYRSSDRDYFDSNALAGAPTPKAQGQAKPSTAACTTTAVSDTVPASEPHLERLESGDWSVHIEKQFDTRSVAICDFTFDRGLSVEEAGDSGRNSIETFILNGRHP